MKRSELFIKPNKEQQFANTLVKVLKCSTESSRPVDEIVEIFVSLSEDQKEIVERLIVPTDLLLTLSNLSPLLDPIYGDVEENLEDIIAGIVVAFKLDEDFYNEQYEERTSYGYKVYNHSNVFASNTLKKVNEVVLNEFLFLQDFYPYSDIVTVHIEEYGLESSGILEDVNECLQSNIHLLVDYVAIEEMDLFAETIVDAKRYINKEIKELEFAVRVMKKELDYFGKISEEQINAMIKANEITDAHAE